MTSISTANQAQTQAQNLQKLLAEASNLQTQTATGEKSQTFAGLGGSDAVTSIRSNASLASLTNYDTNITNGQTRLNVMTSSVTQIQQEANSVSAAMESQMQNGNFDMSSLNSIAGNALSFIKNLLNQTDGNTYVFAGSASSTPPLSDTGTLDTSSNTAIQQWTAGTITTDQFIASFTNPSQASSTTPQLTDAAMGYSAPLTTGQAQPVSIKADDDASVDYTVLANNPAFKSILAAITTITNITNPSPPTGTGSGLTQVATTGSDPTGTVTAPGATASDQSTNFYKVFNQLISTLNTASTGIDQISAKLGYAQSSLQTIQANHTLDENTLQSQVADSQQADMNTVATQLSALETQLQASYSITASLQQYSLVNYLPTT